MKEICKSSAYYKKYVLTSATILRILNVQPNCRVIYSYEEDMKEGCRFLRKIL